MTLLKNISCVKIFKKVEKNENLLSFEDLPKPKTENCLTKGRKNANWINIENFHWNFVLSLYLFFQESGQRT